MSVDRLSPTPQTPLKSWSSASESKSTMEYPDQTVTTSVALPVDPEMMSHSPGVDSSTTQRLTQKYSGPFDIEFAGVTNGCVASAESDEVSMAIKTNTEHSVNELDMSNLLQTDYMLPGSPDILQETFNFDKCKSMDDFVDLCNLFLQNENTESVVEDLVIQQPLISEDHNSNTKRGHEDVDETVPVPSDHMAYTKVKRARFTSGASSTESEVESTSGMSSSEKYAMRRIKNNIASRQSRRTRKQKYIDMEKKAKELEKANEKLKTQIGLLEELTKEMKSELIKLMTK